MTPVVAQLQVERRGEKVLSIAKVGFLKHNLEIWLPPAAFLALLGGGVKMICLE